MRPAERIRDRQARAYACAEDAHRAADRSCAEADFLTLDITACTDAVEGPFTHMPGLGSLQLRAQSCKLGGPGRCGGSAQSSRHALDQRAVESGIDKQQIDPRRKPGCSQRDHLIALNLFQQLIERRAQRRLRAGADGAHASQVLAGDVELDAGEHATIASRLF